MTPALADPLRPSPDEAREKLQRELVNPEYQRDNWLERLLDWLRDRFDDGIGAASGVPSLPSFALIVVFLLLAAGVLTLAARVRGSARAASPREAVLPDERIPATEYRRRADAAFAEGRYADAVVDGFRAVAARQVERGRLDDLPGATAHEIADRLAADFVDRAPLVQRVARLFDEVRYGDHPASSADAASVLSLDEDLAGVR